uniref:NADH dehydrogenase subunit 6 n=1 Tax=Knipowitschia caucasica TaxID=637954 RepID=A0AAV2M090_KNICA
MYGIGVCWVLLGGWVRNCYVVVILLGFGFVGCFGLNWGGGVVLFLGFGVFWGVWGVFLGVGCFVWGGGVILWYWCCVFGGCGFVCWCGCVVFVMVFGLGLVVLGCGGCFLG